MTALQSAQPVAAAAPQPRSGGAAGQTAAQTLYHAAVLPKGTRVVRGPTWQWGEQDSRSCGTTEVDPDSGWVRVCWDASPGQYLSYRWSPGIGVRDVVPLEGAVAPLPSLPAVLPPGTRVIRGPTWQWCVLLPI